MATGGVGLAGREQHQVWHRQAEGPAENVIAITGLILFSFKFELEVRQIPELM